ncbi:MAG: Nif3-like dinuclear metal center hexameric protein [Pontimonas sp.]
MSKSTKPLSEVVDILESLWPSSGAEEWDAPGLVVGSPDHMVSSVHLMVDATLDSIAEAVQDGADLIVAHHPLLLRGVTTVAESTYKGRVIADLIRGGVALYAAHTNADVVPTGTSAQLANLLELTDQVTLTESVTPGHGLGRVGTLPSPMSLYELAVKVGEFLPQTAVGPVVAGDAESMVSRVSVCAGAGDSLLDNPAVLSSDVYITSDLRHHPASEAREQAALVGGPSLINISHFAAEWLWLDQAAAELAKATGLSVTVSDVNTDPWSFQVHRVGG